MKICMLTAVFTMVLVGSFKIQAQNTNGIVVWSEGNGCERELKFNRLENGNLGPKQTAIKKDSGVDIGVKISFDGKWIAFGRTIGFFSGRYGKCDCMAFNKFDIYIARIDGALPAKPIKIGHGYWPSWGDDSDETTKTLYYNVFEEKAYYKTIIKPDGSFSTPMQHAEWPENLHPSLGNNCTMEISPNGRYIAYRRGGLTIWDITEKKNIPAGGGYFPSWGPRSKYLIWRDGFICKIENGQAKRIGNPYISSGLSGYWPTFSNDAEYDHGKLWIIGMTKSCCRNRAGPVAFKEIDISGGQWNVGKSTEVGNGTSADIHIFGSETGIRTKTQMNKIDNGLTFNAKVQTGANGLQLVINSQTPAEYTAELYDLQGKKRVYIEVLKSCKTIMPLIGIANGRYVLQLNTDKVSAQETVLIAR